MTTPPGGVPAGRAGVPATGPHAPEDAGVGRTAETVATYRSYADAQRAIDYLPDQNFPVERTAIVGTDLRLVENVLGRLTTGWAAVAGAAGGHAATRGRRDFTSRGTLRAREYAVTVDAVHAEQARQLLVKLREANPAS